jgi:hypothetical protein
MGKSWDIESYGIFFSKLLGACCRVMVLTTFSLKIPWFCVNQKVSLCIILLTGRLFVGDGASFGYPIGIKATGRISLGALMTFLASSSLNAPIQHEPRPSE